MIFFKLDSPERIHDLLEAVIEISNQDSKKPAPPPLKTFINWIIKKSKVSIGELLLVCLYLQRLKLQLPADARGKLKLEINPHSFNSSFSTGLSCTRHRIFVATMILASKFAVDLPTVKNNRQWSQLSNWFSVHDVNLMERQLLSLLKFQLFPKPGEIEVIYKCILEMNAPSLSLYANGTEDGENFDSENEHTRSSLSCLSLAYGQRSSNSSIPGMICEGTPSTPPPLTLRSLHSIHKGAANPCFQQLDTDSLEQLASYQTIRPDREDYQQMVKMVRDLVARCRVDAQTANGTNR